MKPVSSRMLTTPSCLKISQTILFISRSIPNRNSRLLCSVVKTTPVDFQFKLLTSVLASIERPLVGEWEQTITWNMDIPTNAAYGWCYCYCRFRGQVSQDDNRFTLEYWRVLTIKLAFVILFEVIHCYQSFTRMTTISADVVAQTWALCL